MQQPLPHDEVGAQVALLAAEVLSRADDVADAMVEHIHKAVPVYRTGAVVSADELHATCLANIGLIFGSMGRAPAVISPESRENGRLRAGAGVPLTAVMEAYRVAARVLWDRLAETAARREAPAEVALRAASEMWLVLDTFSQQMAEGYREELTSQMLVREQERSALVQALLEGRLGDANLWETADLLRLPHQGPYVVVAATVPTVGRHALPRIERELRSAGMASAWRLLHNEEVGIAHLPRPAHHLPRLAETLGAASAGRVGVSPAYDDLRKTAQALRFARLALGSALDGQSVVFFDEAPLAVAAISAPDVMQHLARTALAALDGISASERSLLLETFEVWLDNGGSANEAAKRIFCHPNTVRHRLRRLEERTGRSLADPRTVAELALALEIDRRRTDLSTG